MAKKFFIVRTAPLSTDIALLLLRFATGIAFLQHGWMKIQAPFSWMGPDAHIPGVFQALAALSEFGGGGLALLLGLVTRLGALGLFFTMLVAVSFHAFVFHDPFVNPTGGASYELAALYFLLSILFLTSGPGRFSADRYLFGTRHEGPSHQ